MLLLLHQAYLPSCTFLTHCNLYQNPNEGAEQYHAEQQRREGANEPTPSGSPALKDFCRRHRKWSQGRPLWPFLPSRQEWCANHLPCRLLRVHSKRGEI